MTPEEYKAKYGGVVVMGVDHTVTDGLQKEGFTCRRDAIRKEDSVLIPLQHLIARELCPRLRWEAECDPSFKQVIPYVVLEHKPTGRVYMTTRLGGDERLIGQLSIGLGGHIDEDETVLDCLCRELKEEVGLEWSELNDITFCGFIYSTASEVDRVHVGMVFRVYINREDITCLEANKLAGGWFTLEQLAAARASGRMESWSVIAYDALWGGKD